MGSCWSFSINCGTQVLSASSDVACKVNWYWVQADLSINSQILRWLQEEIDARHFIHRRLQTGDDFLHPIITFIQRFEVDLQTRTVQRRVSAINANK